MTRDAKRPNKPDELLLWLRGRYPNDTDEQLTKRFREHARDGAFAALPFLPAIEAGAPALASTVC
jgi:hypothetical protein